MARYRITETMGEGAVLNRSNIEQARALAYDALYRMIGSDRSTGWKHFETIHDWTGKHTILRSNGNAITLETL